MYLPYQNSSVQPISVLVALLHMFSPCSHPEKACFCCHALFIMIVVVMQIRVTIIATGFTPGYDDTLIAGRGQVSARA